MKRDCDCVYFGTANLFRGHCSGNVCQHLTLLFFFLKGGLRTKVLETLYHGQEIRNPGNHFSCEDVVSAATWNRTGVGKFSGAFGSIFGKVWIDSFRDNSTDACSNDMVENSVKIKETGTCMFISLFYELLWFDLSFI